MSAPSPKANAGFTLLEVLVAVAILGLSLSSLLTSQISAMRATQYARGLSSAALLAEYQLIEIEYLMEQEGWTDADVDYHGDFSDQGWPETRYECKVLFIELPEYTQLVDAKAEQDAEIGGQQEMIQDAGEQAFAMLGPVWGMLKNAIENTIRKATCTVYWEDAYAAGDDPEHEFSVETFWVHPQGLRDIPGLGGEVGGGTKGSDPGANGGGNNPKSGGGGGGGSRSGGQGNSGSSGKGAPKVNPAVGRFGGAGGGGR